eukprot:gene10018-26098_t
MASHDVYVKADGSGVARFNVDFHPFLKEAGKVQSDYNTFTIGAPPASLFAVGGTADCPDHSGQDDCEDTMKAYKKSGLLNRFD